MKRTDMPIEAFLNDLCITLRPLVREAVARGMPRETIVAAIVEGLTTASPSEPCSESGVEFMR
jgi:hypothetical protein